MLRAELLALMASPGLGMRCAAAKVCCKTNAVCENIQR